VRLTGYSNCVESVEINARFRLRQHDISRETLSGSSNLNQNLLKFVISIFRFVHNQKEGQSEAQIFT